VIKRRGEQKTGGRRNANQKNCSRVNKKRRPRISGNGLDAWAAQTRLGGTFISYLV
jgi:hypothetical protein